MPLWAIESETESDEEPTEPEGVLARSSDAVGGGYAPNGDGEGGQPEPRRSCRQRLRWTTDAAIAWIHGVEPVVWQFWALALLPLVMALFVAMLALSLVRSVLLRGRSLCCKRRPDVRTDAGGRARVLPQPQVAIPGTLRRLVGGAYIGDLFGGPLFLYRGWIGHWSTSERLSRGLDRPVTAFTGNQGCPLVSVHDSTGSGALFDRGLCRRATGRGTTWDNLPAEWVRELSHGEAPVHMQDGKPGLTAKRFTGEYNNLASRHRCFMPAFFGVSTY
eukprot:COSAG05_NODE_816_length_7150_cov_3.975606_10_plen_275_part_00